MHISDPSNGDVSDRRLVIIEISCTEYCGKRDIQNFKRLDGSLIQKWKGDTKNERDMFRNTRALFASSPFYPFGLDSFPFDPLSNT